MSENHQRPSLGSKGAVVELRASDLNSHGGVFCPNPNMTLWSGHPKAYLGLSEAGQARCPYCSTLYKLKDGEHVSAHH
jgi:uncharacterized Zn-finger protein